MCDECVIGGGESLVPDSCAVMCSLQRIKAHHTCDHTLLMFACDEQDEQTVKRSGPERPAEIAAVSLASHDWMLARPLVALHLTRASVCGRASDQGHGSRLSSNSRHRLYISASLRFTTFFSSSLHQLPTQPLLPSFNFDLGRPFITNKPNNRSLILSTFRLLQTNLLFTNQSTNKYQPQK
jgi:hypothetical protein